MFEIHLYGIFRKKFKPNASYAEDTVISLPNKKNEKFQDFLKHLGLSSKECGDCFINGKLAHQDTIIPENARIGLFPLGMHLLDVGQHVKRHGFISTNPFNNLEHNK